MKTLLPLITVLFAVTSCNSQQNEAGRIFMLETLQSTSRNEFYKGEESRMMFKEMLQDRSSGETRLAKTKALYTTVQTIDKTVAEQISLIEQLKRELFKSAGEDLSTGNTSSVLIRAYDLQNPSSPASYNFSHVKSTKGSAVLKTENSKKIIASILSLRKQICESLVSSSSIPGDEKKYFFKDPEIHSFKDEADFNKQFDAAIENSNIAPDDLESVRYIYKLLSKSDKDWEAIMGEKESWIDAVSVLLSVESTILQARSMAFSVVRSRIGCNAEYSFTNIVPLVYGPSAASPGEIVELQVFMAAFDADQQPVLTVSGGKLDRVENGKGYVKVTIPKAAELNVAGEITVINKSGIPKTMKWSHGIKVISEK